MVPATTADGDTLQSVRSSCDRCRFYKLKCTVPTQSEGPLPCERCTRAKVPCVFGRRRRAARTAEANHKQQQQQQQQQRSATPSTAPAVSTMLATPPSLTPPTTTPATDTISAGSTGAWGLPPQQGFLFGDLYVLDTNNVPTHGSQQQQRGGATFAWDWSQHGFSLEDTYMLDTDLVGNNPPDQDQGGSSQSPTLLAMTPTSMQQQPTTDDMTTMAAIGGDTKPGEEVGNSPALGLWPLLALTAEMQQTLKMLNEGPWRLGGGDEGSEASFDNYPVGTVLHLLQEFGAVAGPVLRKAASAGEAMSASSSTVNERNFGSGGTTSDGSDNGGMGERGEAPHTSERGSEDGEGAGTAGPTGDGPAVNTATIMLILGGYMWLSHICNTVLGHFHTYLSRIPPGADRTIIPGQVGGSDGSGGGGGSIRAASTTSPTLKLGELPCFSAAPDLGKIHNALSMILAAMGGIEEQLGTGGVVARNLVVSALVSHGAVDGTCGELEDGYRKLDQKVQSVKVLLREKMGL